MPMLGVGLTIILLGFALIVAGILLLAALGMRGRKGGAEVGGAGVVFIGPLPVMVASDKEMARLGVLLTVVAALLFILLLLLPTLVR